MIKIKCFKNEPATFNGLIKSHIFQLKKKDFNWSISYFSKCSSFTTHFQTALHPFSANDRRFFTWKKLRIKLNHFNSLGKSKLGEKREKTKCWIGRNVFTFILNWKKFPAFLSQIIFFNLVGKKIYATYWHEQKIVFYESKTKYSFEILKELLNFLWDYWSVPNFFYRFFINFKLFMWHFRDSKEGSYESWNFSKRASVFFFFFIYIEK